MIFEILQCLFIVFYTVKGDMVCQDDSVSICRCLERFTILILAVIDYNSPIAQSSEKPPPFEN
jgi:hypothetical protein